MTALAAGVYRRTGAERTDQYLSWMRSDQAFFAAGACHILAWACQQVYVARSITIAAVRFAGESKPFHVYAVWGGWAFDHAGWNCEADLLEANARFEDRLIERIDLTGTIQDFCERHAYRAPAEFWTDPGPRANRFVAGCRPPWT